MAKVKYEVQMFPHADNPKAWSAKVTPYYDQSDFAFVFGRMEKAMADAGATVKRDGRTWRLSFVKPPLKHTLKNLSRAIAAAWFSNGVEHIRFTVALPSGWVARPAAQPAAVRRLSKTEVQVLSHKRFTDRLYAIPKWKQRQKELLWWLEGVAARTNLPIGEIMEAMEGVVK